jgi:hypothetical protein
MEHPWTHIAQSTFLETIKVIIDIFFFLHLGTSNVLVALFM